MKKRFKVGEAVVTREDDDAQVYRVSAVSGLFVSLTYKTGRGEVCAGTTDVSLLRRPTRAQVDNCEFGP